MANNLTVAYKGSTIHTASSSGSATLNTAGKYMEGDVALTYTFEGGGMPIDVPTAAGMDAVLIATNVGKVYRFTGTTDATYTNGDLYIVEVA